MPVPKDAVPNPDVRWKQRFSNYIKAFQALTRAVELAKSRELSELEEQGLIQGFEFTHELAWNLLKDYLEDKGIVGLIGSRDAARAAFQNGLLEDGEAWMAMIRTRNQTSHTYEPAIAREAAEAIRGRFYPAFAALAKKFAGLADADGAS